MSKVTIQNGTLTVTVDSVGGALDSIRRADVEYVWVADPEFW